MSDTSSARLAKADFFGGYFEELEGAAEKQAVADKWAKLARPEWVAEVYQHAGLERIMAPAAREAREPFPDLPDFRITRELDRGGRGVVYQAWQKSLRRGVAVKVRPPRLAPEAQERFLREQHVLAHRHPTHFIPIHTAGQHGDWQ